MSAYGHDPKKIQQRITARAAAEAAIQLMTESVDGDSTHYWKLIAAFIQNQLPDNAGPLMRRVMSDVEARRFENQSMPFGEFKGLPIGSVPLERLDWYAGNDEFKTELTAYLMNHAIRVKLLQIVGNPE